MFTKLVNGFKVAINAILPESPWKVPTIIALGVFTGLLLTVIQLSNATSYMSDSPEACMNCHVMTTEYATWLHSSHREHAVCNDCHVPHENYVRKYFFKAKDGLRHAGMFTFRLEPPVIHLSEDGKEAVQNNCLRCHIDLVHQVSVVNVNANNYKKGQGMLCWDCHREVPHGRVHSDASTPYAMVPKLKKPLPVWIERMFKLRNDE